MAGRPNFGPGCYDSPPADALRSAFLTDEDLQRQTRRDRQTLVCRRRRGTDARTAGDAHRRHASRQGQAGVHAPRRHRRLHHRRQRGEDPGDGEQARPEALLPPLRLPRRPAQPHAPRAARSPPRGSSAQGGEGNAAEEPARATADHEAQDLRRPGTSARAAGAEALEVGGQLSTIAQYRGTGKRKTSVARVILRPGDGTTWFNGRTLEEYFPRQAHRTIALAPLQVAGVEGTFDIRVRVHGGGPSGQAGAVRHGIARGIASAGGNAVVAGVLPTPAVALLTLDLGCVITASHNPPEYNGVKFFDRDGQKLTDEQEEEIEALLDRPGTGDGEIDEVGVATDSYLEHVLERFGSDLTRLRIGVDCANGAYAGLAPTAFTQLCADVKTIDDKPDGDNMTVGCVATNLCALRQLVVLEVLVTG